MYVIGDAANARWLDTVLFRDSAQIRPKTFSDLGAEHWNSLFCTKDAVDIQGIKCVRHQSNCSHQSAKYTTLFLYVLLFPRPLFSSIVPAGTAHLSFVFPGTSYRATVTASLPGRHHLHSFFPALRTGLLSHRPCRNGLSLQRKIVQPRFQTLAKRITCIGSTLVIAQRNAERRRTISVKLKRGRLTSTTIH